MLFDLIADTPDYLKIARLSWIDLDLLPDVTDVYSYCIVGADGFLIPDLFVNLINGENLAGILNQKQKNIVFNRSQFDQAVIDKKDRKSVV